MDFSGQIPGYPAKYLDDLSPNSSQPNPELNLVPVDKKVSKIWALDTNILYESILIYYMNLNTVKSHFLQNSNP